MLAGIMDGVPRGLAAAAARPAVTAVAEAYLRDPAGASSGLRRRNERIQKIGNVVRAALEAGISTADVALGTTLGALRTTPEDRRADLRVGDVAGAVISAATYYGGQVQPAIDGILEGAALVAEERGDDRGEAVAAATCGIIDALEHGIPVAAIEAYDRSA